MSEPSYFDLRLPGEYDPPWWRLLRRRRWRKKYERIVVLEIQVLGLSWDRFSDLPWVDEYSGMMW